MPQPLRKRASSSDQRIIEDTLSAIQRPERDKSAVHTLYAYPAKFQAHVPTRLIENLTEPGELVVDPYGGGATTSACARQLGRSSLHYDLNPLSCLIARAKTGGLHPDDWLRVQELLQQAQRKPFSTKTTSSGTMLSSKLTHSKKSAPSIPPLSPVGILNREESRLFGKTISSAAQALHVITQILIGEKNSYAPLLATQWIKLLRQAGRRDATLRRAQPVMDHLHWLILQLKKIEPFLQSTVQTQHPIFCRSNHDLHLKNGQASIIITSPPYPGVDIEYNLIQIQRRDLKRCFRSDIGVRIANLFYPGQPTKRNLCEGGTSSSQDYFDNAARSLQEMRRVLALGRYAFIYCGFKNDTDRARYEKLIRQAGFKLLERGMVNLSSDRVASSRSTHHGKETQMMKKDFLYVLR